MENYGPQHLSPTFYIDSDNPAIVAFAQKHTEGAGSQQEMAVRLYYAVRDGFRYNPYNLRMKPSEVTAGHLLQEGEGHCIDKALFLAACARAVGIPSRLEFADVKNHISSQKFVDMLKSDVFAMHGITQMFVEGKWVKCTPAFNQELCDLFNVAPLEFDGLNDSLFHEFDKADNRFMEYVAHHGVFDDFPRNYFVGVMIRNYPHLFDYDRLREVFVEVEEVPASS